MDVDLVKDISAEFNSRWKVMEKKRQAIEMDILHHREVSGEPPVMEYPGEPLETWDPESESETKPFEPQACHADLRDLNGRRNLLLEALTVNNDPYIGVVNTDKTKCLNLYTQPRVHARVKALLQHPQLIELLEKEAWFLDNDPSGGVVINGTEFHHEGVLSTLSAFMPRFASEDAQAGSKHTTLTYAAGLRYCANSDTNLLGGRGLMRSLCTQLLQAWPFAFRLHFLAREGPTLLESVRGGNVHTLCVLFRNLLCDVARYTSAQMRQAPEELMDDEVRAITVIIDGINFLEDNDFAGFCHVVYWFRSICDETYWAKFCGLISFRYVLIHPRVSKLLQFPYPSEAPVFLLEPE